MEASPIHIYCATSNPGKVREFQEAAAALESATYVAMLPGIGEIVPPDETGCTFEANAVLKASYYSQFSDHLVFADDSGLCVAALGGDPGVYSARYGGDALNDMQRTDLLLHQMAGVANREAWFECVIAVALKGDIKGTFRGRVDGRIVHSPQGAGGFGYDPIFYFPPLGLTLAELSTEEKRAISHRGAAFRTMLDWLGTATESPSRE